jgi:cytochrome c oxidase subunit III
VQTDVHAGAAASPEPGLGARIRGHRAGLAHHFDTYEQQREAASLGMWVFLVTEVLFFGALFVAYTVYRWLYPDVFTAGSLRLDVTLGTINTAVLLTSSLTMALGVRSAQTGRGKLCAALLVATVVLGGVFLGIKYEEYHHKWTEHLIPGAKFHLAGVDRPMAQLFFCLYFGMTGLHALHMVIGIVLLLGVAVAAYLGWFGPRNYNFVEGLGLYWHFVDIVWIFLFPLLYLVNRHG